MDDFDQTLIKIIGDKNPETLEEAVRLARLRFIDGKEAIIDRVLRLESEGMISFEKQLAIRTEMMMDLRSYVKRNRFKIALFTLVSLIFIGFSFILIPNIAIYENEQLLGTSSLNIEERWRYEGALQ